MGLILVCGLAIFERIKAVLNLATQCSAADRFRNAANWLVQNSNEGDIVFNTQWDEFPELFYWDQNYYIVGMD